MQVQKDTHKSREDQQIKLFASKIKKIIEIIKSNKLAPSFEPSMKILLRILKVIAENDAKGKTQISLYANVHYTKLAKHIVWLEKKGLVKSAIEDNKINVILTTKGTEFASMLLKID
ncbi:MAG: winged helix-turn-helix domain-containing protein [Nitrosotalea sp.]